MHKHFFLSILCFIVFNAQASISYIQSESAVHIYSNIDEKSLLSIPINGHEFVVLSSNIVDVKEKLGSYDIEKSGAIVSKDFKVVEVVQLNDGEIIVKFELMYNNEVQTHQLNIAEYKVASDSKGIWFHVATKDFDASINNITFNIPDFSEAIFGGGIQFSYCNVKGHKFPLLVEENGVGRGDKGPTFWANLFGAAGNEYTTYSPSTYFITNQKQFYNLYSRLNNHYWEVDYTQEGIVSYSIQVLDIKFNGSPPVIYTGIQTDLLSNNFYQKEDAELEEWMYGYILGIQGGKEKVNQTILSMKGKGIEVNAVWIQDWVGKRKTPIGSRLQWDWKSNESYYPNIAEWIDSLHQENIKVLGYINPYFVEGGEQAEEGLANEYFVKTKDGEAYKFKAGGFNAYMLDLNNIEARDWVTNIINENLVGNGFDGWMCDFGEWYPFENLYEEGYQFVYHNNYPREWVNLNLENRDSFFIFNRSWYSSDINRAPPKVMWLGDQMSNFGKNDGLASAVNAYNSASFSGIPLVHSDIGGYTAIKVGPFKYLRDDELLKRWIEMEAFTPIWRSHEGLLPDKMSQLYQDDEMMSFFAHFDSIHQSLVPYFQSVNQEMMDEGYPMVRHPFLHYPDDKNTYDLQYQFMVGSELMVCPVIEADTENVNVYLPEGKWKHFFTNEIYDGAAYYDIEAPVGLPAVFWLVE
ncbi:MAG: alpha-glucosidase [Chitinophagales bacterium]